MIFISGRLPAKSNKAVSSCELVRVVTVEKNKGSTTKTKKRKPKKKRGVNKIPLGQKKPLLPSSVGTKLGQLSAKRKMIDKPIFSKRFAISV